MSIGKLAVLAVALALASGGVGAALVDWHAPDPVAPIVLTGKAPAKADRDGPRVAIDRDGDAYVGGRRDRAAKPARKPAAARVDNRGARAVSGRTARAGADTDDDSTIARSEDDDDRDTSAAAPSGDSDDKPEPQVTTTRDDDDDDDAAVSRADTDQDDTVGATGTTGASSEVEADDSDESAGSGGSGGDDDGGDEAGDE